MGYQQTLEANGVIVKHYKEFGSYQGTWISVLEDGRFIEGSYGSCSGCDAFEAEFGYGDEPEINDGKYYLGNRSWDEGSLSTLDQYEIDKKTYEKRLKDFGKSYLDSAETKEEIISRYKIKCEGEYSWEDDKEILEWLLTH